VLFGGSIMGIFAGIYYWWPKLTGRILNEKLGKLNFWLIFIGMNVTFFPMHFVGMNGMPRRIYTYSSEFGWGDLNMMASVGYLVLFVGFLVFLYNILQNRNARRVSHDPWDAPGVEWSIASPPPAYNFAEVPNIKGRDHYWIMKDEAREAGNPITEPEPAVDPRTIHMPSPSYWPVITAIGVGLIGGGLLSHYGVSFLGGLIAFIGVIGWSNEPPAAEEGH
jgi:cytochrome c oxidase subunit 1